MLENHNSEREETDNGFWAQLILKSNEKTIPRDLLMDRPPEQWGYSSLTRVPSSCFSPKPRSPSFLCRFLAPLYKDVNNVKRLCHIIIISLEPQPYWPCMSPFTVLCRKLKPLLSQTVKTHLCWLSRSSVVLSYGNGRKLMFYFCVPKMEKKQQTKNKRDK